MTAGCPSLPNRQVGTLSRRPQKDVHVANQSVGPLMVAVYLL
jgi:hypothetical protein